MTRFIPNPFRTLGLAIVTLATAVMLTVPTITPAQADGRGWHRGHGHSHGHAGRHWKRQKQHRVRHHRRHNRHDGDHAPRGSSGNLMDGISGGNILGGILGAAAGSQVGKGTGRTVAILGGAILGAVLGGKAQQSMEAADQARAHATLERTPTGQTVAWSNPDTGATFNVTPTKTYKVESGQFCRNYTTWVFIDGYEEQAKGTACRSADGTWTPTTN